LIEHAEAKVAARTGKTWSGKRAGCGERGGALPFETKKKGSSGGAQTSPSRLKTSAAGWGREKKKKARGPEGEGRGLQGEREKASRGQRQVPQNAIEDSHKKKTFWKKKKKLEESDQEGGNAVSLGGGGRIERPRKVTMRKKYKTTEGKKPPGSY